MGLLDRFMQWCKGLLQQQLQTPISVRKKIIRPIVSTVCENPPAVVAPSPEQHLNFPISQATVCLTAAVENLQKIHHFLGDYQRYLQNTKSRALAQYFAVDQHYESLYGLCSYLESNQLLLDLLSETEKKNWRILFNYFLNWVRVEKELQSPATIRYEKMAQQIVAYHISLQKNNSNGASVWMLLTYERFACELFFLTVLKRATKKKGNPLLADAAQNMLLNHILAFFPNWLAWQALCVDCIAAKKDLVDHLFILIKNAIEVYYQPQGYCRLVARVDYFDEPLEKLHSILLTLAQKTSLWTNPKERMRELQPLFDQLRILNIGIGGAIENLVMQLFENDSKKMKNFILLMYTTDCFAHFENEFKGYVQPVFSKPYASNCCLPRRGVIAAPQNAVEQMHERGEKTVAVSANSLAFLMKNCEVVKVLNHDVTLENAKLLLMRAKCFYILQVLLEEITSNYQAGESSNLANLFWVMQNQFATDYEFFKPIFEESLQLRGARAEQVDEFSRTRCLLELQHLEQLIGLKFIAFLIAGFYAVLGSKFKQSDVKIPKAAECKLAMIQTFDQVFQDVPFDGFADTSHKDWLMKQRNTHSSLFVAQMPEDSGFSRENLRLLVFSDEEQKIFASQLSCSY